MPGSLGIPLIVGAKAVDSEVPYEPALTVAIGKHTIGLLR
jgi:hypothetical protein